MTQRQIVRPSVEAIVAIHTELINKIGGSHGIRDESLLDLSVNAPFQTFGGRELFV